MEAGIPVGVMDMATAGTTVGAVQYTNTIIIMLIDPAGELPIMVRTKAIERVAAQWFKEGTRHLPIKEPVVVPEEV